MSMKTDLRFDEDDFVQRAGRLEELTVTITLSEYRGLIADQARLETSVERLEQEKTGLQEELESAQKALATYGAPEILRTIGNAFSCFADGPEQNVCGEPESKGAFDSTLKTTVTADKNLAEIISGIKTGSIKLSIGDSISTCMKSGRAVDFVVTDIDDEAYRFESRDCLGRYDPMTKIDRFYTDVWDDLPAALRDNIIETVRCYKDKDGRTQVRTQKLFLPAASEIFPPDSCYGDEGLYTQLPWYADVHNRVRAFEKGGASDWYWTQSAYSGNTTYFCRVNYYGLCHHYYASYTYIAAPVCFRISRV